MRYDVHLLMVWPCKLTENTVIIIEFGESLQNLKGILCHKLFRLLKFFNLCGQAFNHFCKLSKNQFYTILWYHQFLMSTKRELAPPPPFQCYTLKDRGTWGRG